MTHLNGVIERIFSIIKEVALAILINEKPNKDTQKMLWTEAVHTCKRVRNSMDTTGITTSPFENFHGKNPRSLVCSQSLDVSDTSLNRRSLGSK